jgi:hypothetical protein
VINLVGNLAEREALAMRLAGELERFFSEPTATAAQLSFVLGGALESSVTDEAWSWALSALERGEARVVVK